MPMYGLYGELIKKFIKFTRDMNKNIFYTSLEKIEKDEMGKRFSLPDIAGSIAQKCPALFDFVFHMKVFEREGEEVRVLITKKKDGSIAKDRSGKLDEYVKPDLGAIIDKVFKKGEK